MTARFAPEARRHLQAISRYLGEQNPRAVLNIGRAIRKAVRLLEAFPSLGHTGAAAGTLEFPVRGHPYIIVYRLEQNDPGTSEGANPVIVGIYHGAQLRPGQRKP